MLSVIRHGTNAQLYYRKLSVLNLMANYTTCMLYTPEYFYIKEVFPEQDGPFQRLTLFSDCMENEYKSNTDENIETNRFINEVADVLRDT